eukprot:TRINITY_DN6471_c0_g1_i18.p1 TRINITY_DN6471_c0_g1~~TRINITY_DN6471_c0_g1_i18.p1  ORF type:complete len:249 (+),score=-6.66 TRINITY_DN6471_c0_g1_i18:175-921(+)
MRTMAHQVRCDKHRITGEHMKLWRRSCSRCGGFQKPQRCVFGNSAVGERMILWIRSCSLIGCGGRQKPQRCVVGNSAVDQSCQCVVDRGRFSDVLDATSRSNTSARTGNRLQLARLLRMSSCQSNGHVDIQWGYAICMQRPRSGQLLAPPLDWSDHRSPPQASRRYILHEVHRRSQHLSRFYAMVARQLCAASSIWRRLENVHVKSKVTKTHWRFGYNLYAVPSGWRRVECFPPALCHVRRLCPFVPA